MRIIRKMMVPVLAALLAFQCGAACVSAATPKQTAGTTARKASTKVTTKKKKVTKTLKKKAKKTQTKKTTTTSTKTKKSTDGEYQKTVTTTVKTVTKWKYTKGSKKAKGTATVKTTVKTEYVLASLAVNDDGSDRYRDLTEAEKKTVGTTVANAFSALGFQVVVESEPKGYSGYFETKTKLIHLYNGLADENIIYHEIGHFVAFVAGNADAASAFSAVYAAEKGNYTKYNKPYVTGSASEYFAECYKLYLTDPSWLKSSLPKTYAYIQQSLAKITDTQVARTKKSLAAAAEA